MSHRPRQPAEEQARAVAPEAGEGDLAEASLRPQRLEEFIGQRQVRANLRVFVDAARGRGEALDHVLDAADELAHVVGFHRREARHAQLVAAELAVGVGVEDVIGPQRPVHRDCIDRVVEVDRAHDVRSLGRVGDERGRPVSGVGPAVERCCRLGAAPSGEVHAAVVVHPTDLGIEHHERGERRRVEIARALATDPEIMLFDEPTSALDPIATVNIEELMSGLKNKLSILIVTHNMQQAARISDYTAYMYLGEMIEFDATDKIFTNPGRKETEDYITGKFG